MALMKTCNFFLLRNEVSINDDDVLIGKIKIHNEDVEVKKET